MTSGQVVVFIYLLLAFGSNRQEEKIVAAKRNMEILKSRAESAGELISRPRLFVAILSAQNYSSRRQAIRETWMQDCDLNRGVVCKFFTDGLNERGDPIPDNITERLEDESKKNRNDLIILDTPSGVNFAIRLLALMEWGKENLEFDYLLRIDDDNFLCLDRLIEELPVRPRKRLYWGYLHCIRGLTRIDEGFMILSVDLVLEFLRDRDQLLCHKFGDQAVAMWIYRSMNIEPITWFADNRIHHDPPASYILEFKHRKEICHTFLNLHGTYPSEMEVFQKIVSREKRNLGTSYDIPPVIDNCPYSREVFYWGMMGARYFARPVPCKDEPTWVRASSYVGRGN
eukprot:gene9818-10825_t